MPVRDPSALRCSWRLAYTRRTLFRVWVKCRCLKQATLCEKLAASLARARGDNFFPALAAHLGEVIGASTALVCEAAANRRARTLGGLARRRGRA